MLRECFAFCIYCNYVQLFFHSKSLGNSASRLLSDRIVLNLFRKFLLLTCDIVKGFQALILCWTDSIIRRVSQHFGKSIFLEHLLTTPFAKNIEACKICHISTLMKHTRTTNGGTFLLLFNARSAHHFFLSLIYQ